MHDPVRPLWVEAALAEYDAHRAEVVSEAQAQQHILALGATAIGVVIAGAFNVWDDQLLATLAFLLVVPLLSALVLIQWAGRATAMMRVGVYLERLERTLASHTSAPVPILTWEETLAAMRPAKPWTPQAGWNDFGAVGIFALLSAGSIALGAYKGWNGHEWGVATLAVIQGVLLVVFVVFLARGVLSARQEARKNFDRKAPGLGDVHQMQK
jgi:hypothetical protein